MPYSSTSPRTPLQGLLGKGAALQPGRLGLVLASPATHKLCDLGQMMCKPLTPYLQNGDSHLYLRG